MCGTFCLLMALAALYDSIVIVQEVFYKQNSRRYVYVYGIFLFSLSHSHRIDLEKDSKAHI